MDYLKIAVAELASISERRTAKLVDPNHSEGLPAFLIPKEQAGLSSGYMIPQYVSAALVSENKVLAHPASVDSIPISANQEDHVSMGTIAARQAKQIIENATHVLVIELMCAVQGLDFRQPLNAGQGAKFVHSLIRSKVPYLAEDRVLYTDIESIREIVDTSLLKQLEEHIGVLL